MMNKLRGIICLIFAVSLFSGCQKLRPEQVQIPEYPDLKSFYLEQAKKLEGMILEKTVVLDSSSETNRFDMDSTKWADELSFFIEMNPNQPEYVGVFEKSTADAQTKLVLKEGEKAILKRLVYTMEGDSYSSVQSTIHEDKDVYIHHREIKVQLEDGRITSFDIQGYQKVILKDTVWFGITGAITN